MGLQQVGTSLTQFLVGAISAVIGLTVVLALTGFLVIRLFEIDPIPYQVAAARIISGGRVVSFEESIPPRLADNLEVQDIERVDTDGDGFREWLVFYKFDTLRTGSSRAPTLGAIYDSDRGNPPVIFPYLLRAPNRDYLSEGEVHFEQVEITDVTDFADIKPMELLIWGDSGGLRTELTIFRLGIPNSADWDFPRDERPLYEVIGFFRGSGGVAFDPNTMMVTVTDRDGFERSQLAVKTIYRLNNVSGTYLDVPQGASLTAATLGAPASSTIDFAYGKPEDVFDTSFPEKILLGFYQALADPSLHVAPLSWDPKLFLEPGSRAAIEFENNFLPYFGFPNNGQTVRDLSVTRLNYFPRTELVEARDTVLGEQPQRATIQVSFNAFLDDKFVSSDVISFELVVHSGQWKISRRVDINDSDASTASPPGCATPPHAIAIGPTKATSVVNRTVTFYGDRSSGAQGIKEYRWDFGDGQSATGSIVTHQYAQAKDYSAILTVTDNAGCTGSAMIMVHVP
jgi:hypothetical protein